MIRNFFLLFLAIILTSSAKAQFEPLSQKAEISILTIGPGAELYDKFGHSAFRIQDPDTGVDVVFNYGTYDFDTPNFYTKFAQGKLLYELSVEYYTSFYNRYVSQNRWIKSQILNLNAAEKQAVSDFLWNNYRPENKKYKYDFFYDNCATKIRDVLIEVLGNKLEYKEDHITESYTFRDLIQQRLQANSWGSLGIDVALGAVIDKQAKPIEYQFLPDYIFEGAENAVIHRNGTDEKLVKTTEILFENKPVANSGGFIFSPLFVFGILGLLLIYVTIKDYKAERRSRFLDGVIFFVTGLIGVFLLLLWFATDHTATANNYNLLWAFPISILMVIAISKRNFSQNLSKYLFLLLLLLSLLAIHWITGVQIFAIGLLPLLIGLAVRYIFLFGYFRKK
ncbi:lipoprotein N-acyltransferase Lnb domain-containing protein [Aequorivita echinoideorum]|uniref:DUF4105 domain-containing protein n=1 Tax=Aequorivita echinoideorum TaxID=1549647 RepID=A0ABS5S7Y5_9FLAO|nr:DUF4105 domain-containing protein [Aequorivita echinoideorum]MBT0608472.1 DUF4105 domain-containing protein [Aequorivita echinoideorum]